MARPRHWRIIEKFRAFLQVSKLSQGFGLFFDPITGASPGIKDRGEVMRPLLYCNAASLTFAVRQGRISLAWPQFGCRPINAEAPSSSR